MTQFLFAIMTLTTWWLAPVKDSIYSVTKGNISFVSEAQLETIKATSTEVKGVIKTSDNSFAYSVLNRSFHGFNSALQEEHFNENYMHSDRYPFSTFTGNIIEAVNLTVAGAYEVRAKGILDIHGVKQERIIKCRIIVAENQINIQSDFTVLLEDHKINVPRIVNEKIFPEIKVNVNLTLQPK